MRTRDATGVPVVSSWASKALCLQAQEVPHALAQFGSLEWFGEKVLGSGAESARPDRGPVECGDHQDGNALGGGVALDLGRHLIAVHAGSEERRVGNTGRLFCHT